MTPTIHADPPPIRPDETGTLRVGDSRVVLEVLVREYQDGADPESIARAYPTLAVADVYAAIGYYLRHRTELDEYLRWRKEGATKLRQEIESQQPGTPDLRKKLEARRAQQEQDRAASCG